MPDPHDLPGSRRWCHQCRWGTFLLFWCGLAQICQGQSQDGLAAAVALEQSLTQLIEQVEPSVVSVARYRPQPGGLSAQVEGRFLQPGMVPTMETARDLIPNQFATGIIIAPKDSDERYVLTTYHAVRGAPVFGQSGSGDGSRLEVAFTSRRVCAATIYAADPRSDLAVLQIDWQSAGLQLSQLRPLSWSESPEVRKGQLVVTVGNPYWIARDGSASAGWAMVSNLARRPTSTSPTLPGPKTLDGLGGLIHLDARIAVGSSGAPVVNLKGQLVGVTSSIAAIDGFERSGGFAFPMNSTTEWIVETLLQGFEVEYGFLGVTPRSESRIPPGLTTQPSAARVESVLDNSPAQEAGLRLGDLVLSVDGQTVYSDLDLMREVTLHPPGTIVKLTVLRGLRPEPRTVAVKLGKWPTSDDEAIIASQERYPAWRGLTLDYPTARHQFLGSPPHLQQAVLIRAVSADSVAQRAGLEPGLFVAMVNRTRVQTPDEFTAAVKGLTGPVTLTVILTDDTTKTVTLAE
ncbi:PDZ domain-containing protein [bacterium]|nr:PDZ domain-containing protein [bacterium]